MTAVPEPIDPVADALAHLATVEETFSFPSEVNDIILSAHVVAAELNRLRSLAEDRDASIEAATLGVRTTVHPILADEPVDTNRMLYRIGDSMDDGSIDRLTKAILAMPDPTPVKFDDFLDVLAWLTDDTDMRAIQITITADLNAVTSGVDYRYVLKLDEHFGTDATGDTLDGVTTSYLGEGDTLDSASAAAMRQIVTDHQLRSV